MIQSGPPPPPPKPWGQGGPPAAFQVEGSPRHSAAQIHNAKHVLIPVYTQVQHQPNPVA